MAQHSPLYFCPELRGLGASWRNPMNLTVGGINSPKGMLVFCPRCAEDLHTALEAYRAAHLKDAEAAQ